MNSSKPKSFKQKIIASRGNICLYIGKDIHNEDAWYFLYLTNIRKEDFIKLEGTKINLEDYAEIIISGYGKEVPIKELEYMKDNYNFII